MSKRPSGKSVLALSTKKPKIDEPSDFWDDDFDADALDDCFRKATQTIENENPQKDVTLVSNYSIFKQPNNIFTSTQLSQSGSNVNDQIKQLQEKYAEKEGEVSILRSNLQNLRSSCQAEEERKQNEWKEKFNIMEKENKSVRSELEFKNLEVANLKQQINELSKLVNNDLSLSQRNNSRILTSPRKSTRDVLKESPKIYINVEKYYPLRNISSQFLGKEEISRLVQCSDVDLRSYNCQEVTKVSLKHLENFKTCFKDDPHSFRLSEVSLICSDVIDFLGQLFPFSEQLQNELINNNFPVILSSILVTIEKKRKEKSSAKFLSSVINFLPKTLSCSSFVQMCHNTLHQFLLFKLDAELSHQIISFLSVFSRTYSPFSHETGRKETCKFNSFYNNLGNSSTNITFNLVNFVYNTFKLNDPHQKECDCFYKLYKLTIKYVYECLELRQKEFCQIPSMLKDCVKILLLINFNAYDSTQKYTSDFAQLKEIVHNIVKLDAPNVKILEKSCPSEDLPTISSDKFDEIDF